ncbi:MAG: ATP-binding protein [Clostridia bacterium]
MAKTIITTEGLKNSLKNFTLPEAVVEYVWNSLDAGATIIEITEEKNALGGSTYLKIKDDGFGIDRNKLENKFSPLYVSEKNSQNSNEKINIKGKKGIGRYSFYKVAQVATWNTVYKNLDQNIKYSIFIKSDNLIDYTPTQQSLTTEPTGTEVVLTMQENILIKPIIDELKIVFAWYLQLYKNKSIYINREKLDCSDMLSSENTLSDTMDNINVNITVCVWSRKLNEEYSKYYYIDENDKVTYKENTTLNNKGDNFYHSVFIKSNLFNTNNFTFESQLEDGNLINVKTKKSKEFKWLKSVCDSFIVGIRKPFIKKYAKEFIKKLKDKKVYPEFDPKNNFDKYKEDLLDDLIANVYYFVPKVFSSLNLIQQKILIRMFELIQTSGEVNNLFKILDGITDLTSDERKDMADLLQKVELSNLLEMQKLVVDRLQAISDFKELVFNKERYVNEIDHIQKFIEKHYWFFGEEYHLATAEEPNFEEALRTFLNKASDNYYKKGEVTINDKNKNKQMDIFAIQQLPCGNIKKCIVVELKRPNVTLSNVELHQIKTYFETIHEEDRFNASNIEWEFYLVGNEYNNQIEHEIINSQPHGIKSLVYKIDNCKIFVKKWSEIFTELELNFNYLNEKLKFDYSKLTDSSGFTSNEIVLIQETNTSARPEAISS